jgi:hypothetical protein
MYVYKHIQLDNVYIKHIAGSAAVAASLIAVLSIAAVSTELLSLSLSLSNIAGAAAVAASLIAALSL